MSAVTIVDGLGHIHAKHYTSVGALPTPNLGALAIVDNGTGGQLYVSLHDASSTLVWVELAALVDAIVQSPTPGQNAINDTNTGDTALSVTGLATAISASSPEVVEHLEQTGATPVDAVLSLTRDTSTPSKPMIVVSPDGTTSHVPVDGYGSIAVDSYSVLPTPNTNRLGEIARVIAGGSGQDTFWMCVLDAGTPIWTQFIGPTGATGATGATGPAGPTGPAGANGTFENPLLPAPGGATLDFWMPCDGQGQLLPFLIPSGYSVQVIGGWAFWSATGTMEPLFASTFDGVSNTSWPSVVDSRFAVGRSLFITYDSSGNNYLADGTHIYNDALSVLSLTQDTYVVIQPNVNETNLFGSIIWLQVEIVPIAAWSHDYDFTTGQHGWVVRPGPVGQYVSGQGFTNGVGGSPTFSACVFSATRAATISVMDVTLACINPSSGRCDAGNLTTYPSGAMINGYTGANAQSPGGVVNSTASATVSTSDEIYAQCNQSTSSAAGEQYITHVHVSGFGPDPFV